MILCVFQLLLKHSCEQKKEPRIPNLMHVGHCSFAEDSQPGDSHVPKLAIFQVRLGHKTERKNLVLTVLQTKPIPRYFVLK